jgi:hypothetical protein
MEWPGIATTVGIVLILTLIGVGSRDDFHLKDYTSVIAAFVAVGGAVLAYIMVQRRRFTRTRSASAEN